MFILQVPGLVCVCVDVSEVEVVRKEVERLKPIHLLVNNAAVGHLKKFLDVSTEEYDRYSGTPIITSKMWYLLLQDNLIGWIRGSPH